MPVPACSSWRRPTTTWRSSTATREFDPPGEVFAYCNGGFVVLACSPSAASGDAVPRAGRAARLPAGRAHADRLPAHRRAAGRRGARLRHDGRRRALQRVPPPGARLRRRRDLHDARRRVSVVAGARRRRDRAAAVVAEMTRARSVARRWRIRPRVLAAPVARCRVRSRATTPGSRSAPCTIGTHGVGHTVIGNTTDGAWPVSRLLGDTFGTR